MNAKKGMNRAKKSPLGLRTDLDPSAGNAIYGFLGIEMLCIVVRNSAQNRDLISDLQGPSPRKTNI
jgi:hypothetical protein